MSTDEMPDFDSMSPEEMMKWMESLAKRQGATEGMTTSADMQVAEVDPDSVDESVLNQKYVPHGWTEEKWEAHLAKEAEEKAAKEAAAPATPPPPPPTPEPVAAAPPPTPEPAPAASAAEDGDMPDFDSMSPEEMMKWMESLAKRQGATEGMTTSADMQVAEVDPDSVDESVLNQKYVPHGWTEEKWEAHLAKEAEEKAAKEAAAAQAPPTPDPIPEPPTMEMPPQAAFPETPAPDLSDVLPDLDELGDETAPTFPDFMSSGDIEIDEEPEVATPGDAMDWLADLASGGDDSGMPDLTGLADISEPMPELDLGAASDDGDPMDWLASLASDDPAPELDLGDLGMEIPDLGLAESPAQPAASGSPIDTGDDPMNWLESLAKRQGADDEELATSADMDIPMPEGLQTDGPGYNPYSFEDPIGDVDEVYGDEAPTEPIASELGAAQLEFDDPEAWLDSIATGGNPAADFASMSPTPSPDLDDLMDEDEDDLQPVDVDEEEVISRLNQGDDVSPEEIMGFFTQAFDKADEIAELEEAHAPDAEAIPADIPDWLMDQMGGPVIEEETPAPASADAYPAFVDEVTEPSDADEVMEMPDWLQQNIDDGDGDGDGDGEAIDDLSDIFDDVEPTPEPVPPTPEPEPVAAVETPVAKTDLDIDTDDPWVEAFVLENEQKGEMQAWYDQQVGVIEGGGTPATVPETAKVAAEMPPLSPVSLQPAELSAEAELPEGEPEAMPDWLGVGAVAAVAAAAPVEAEPELVPAEIPDWLADAASDDSSTSDEMPDWLAEPAEEAVPAGDDLPDWLAGTDAKPDEIPAWLLDTMDSQEVAIPEVPETPQVIQTPTPAPQPAAIVQQPVSPAPVPMNVANIDVPTTLNNARSKVSNGDVDGAMQDFELVVRANAELDTVQKEVSKLAEDKKHKQNPAVFRVLGDTLMRQGKLQDALETYRKALNRL